MSGFTKGGRDYLDLGTWNAFCAYCGRKRKARELIIDDEFARGLLVCREHRDLRHPQEFARGIKEDMTVPKVQPPLIAFTSLPAAFPLSILPNPIQLIAGTILLTTESTVFAQAISTESGIDLSTETAFSAFVIAVLPPWMSDQSDPFGVFIETLAWSWQSGGVGILIGPPQGVEVELQATSSGLSGILQLTATNNLGQSATATAQVNS